MNKQSNVYTIIYASVMGDRCCRRISLYSFIAERTAD